MARPATSLPVTTKNLNPKPNQVQVKRDSLKCTICSQQFDHLKDCLRHELLMHNNEKAANRPQKSLRHKVNAIINNLKTDDQQTLHTSLSNALHKCEPGQELASIFTFHRMNDENLCMVYERINSSLRKDLHALKSINIYPFGSFVTGLALRDSDIDLYIDHPEVNQIGQSTYWQYISPSQRGIFNRINDILHRSKSFTDVIAIRQARVPIIKCKHSSTGFSMDINLSCPSSVHNTNFLRDLLKLDKRLHELMVFLKVWAKQLQLIGRGNMNSYCLITLVIFYLQQSLPNRAPLLPSIAKLQENIAPQYVVGVNYAYKFPNNVPALPRNQTTSNLIQGFFEFYCNFEFENFLIAPCIGKVIPIEKFKNDTYKYSAYRNQLQLISKMFKKPVEPFQIGRCFHLQDPFALNHNIGKAIAPPNLEYFRNCLQQACSIYKDPNISTDAQRYEALLYGIVERIAQEARVAAEQSNTSSNNGTVGGNNPPNELSLRLTPSRAEQRAIANSVDSNKGSQKKINQLWVEHYLEIIPEIITDIYCLDLQSATPTHSDKQQRLDNTDRAITWQVSGSVDQWTGRLHQRCNNKTFMQVQLEQTKNFLKERRQKAAFSVQLNGVITLNILNDCSAIELTIAPRNKKGTTLSKKDPLHKFFNMFKCSIQNFNLKEWLDMSANKKI
ncbi:terminal uridylyltransferase Tailor [Eurosta solidaginis]|uniref:terminal uridylyltransferase Tailor n=1 Tax=Eurosta solidaginis TaxID=178769 RepID=UPI0035316A75